jgi:HEAT repeat protein
MWIRYLSRALLVFSFCAPLVSRSAAQDAPAADPTEALIASLRSETADARRAAAAKVRASERDTQRRALPAMIDVLMKDKDGQVRLTVLETLAALGPDAAPAVAALVHTLRTDYGGQGREELHQDFRSALALAAIGKPAVEGLRGLLKERKESVRAEAVMSLGRIGPDAEAAIPDLIALLEDKSERLRREASVALGRIGKPAVEPLIDACAHKDVVMRSGAVESLGRTSAPDSRARSAIIACARDDAPAVRAAAVKSLGRLDLPIDELLPILGENLRHDEEIVRLAVVDWLVERPELLRRMAPDLEVLLTAPREGVSRHAAYLLGKIGPEAVARLIQALGHENSRIDLIAESLSQIGRPAVELLSRALQAPDPRVRQGAALALGQIRPVAPGVVSKLAAGLNDPDRAVKGAFLSAIGLLGPRAGESVPAVRLMLNDESAEIRIKAVEILYQSAPRDARLLNDLTPRLRDADERVQRQAIVTIRMLGPLGRTAVPDVIGMLDSKHTKVRLAAAELIGSHGQAAVEAIPALSSLLDDPSPELRTIVAQTLGKLGKAAQPAFPRLTPLLTADEAEVREAAVSALGGLELDADALKPHLAKALRDDKPEVRRATSRAIQRLGPQGAIFVPDIILLADSKDNLRTVERSLRRFESSGPDTRSIPELVKLLDHKNETVRLLSIRFLGLAGPRAKDALPAFERLSEDPSAEIRKQAKAAGEKINKTSGSD